MSGRVRWKKRRGNMGGDYEVNVTSGLIARVVEVQKRNKLMLWGND